MSDWNLPMIEDSIWKHFADECDKTNHLLYDICIPGINDLEDVDRILSCDFGPQSVGFGSQSEAPQSVPRCQDSSDGEIKSQSAVQMEVDDSDIAAVVKSSFQPINTGNNLNNCEMLEKRDPCTGTRNQPADHMNRSTYGLEQIQIFEDKNPLPSVVPSDQPCSSGLSSKYGLDKIQIFEDKNPFPSVFPSGQPCSSGLSSKQDYCGETYTSSFKYNTGNPQFQLENRLFPGLDQIQIFEDKNPLPSVVPWDQPCSSELSSKQNQCGETYTSSYKYNTGNPQFQLENRLLPDQCMGRLFEPSSKPPLSHGQELHNALIAEYRQGQASCSTTFEKEGQKTQHQHEGGIKVEGTSLELPPFNTGSTVQECARSFDMDSTVQETSCMKQVFSNDVTLEATNLLQLHNVMNEMDVGTRQCISNSLYRLARTSIQRPNISNLSNGSSDGIFARNSKRLSECIDANTNLMDQSIAKLLFYKPLDLATSSSAEAMLLRSGMLIGIPL